MEHPATPTIRFAFDFISPYAYLGWKRVRTELQHAEVVPMPVLFAALLDANSTKGPAEIPSKRVYTGKHVLRLAHELGVPISFPPAHPFNPLLGLRVIASDLAADDRATAMDVLYDAVWNGGPGITDPARVAELLSAAGLDGKTLVEGTADPAIKQRVKDSTAEALAAGVFGVPSMLVDEEVFWGQDSIPHLVRYLQGNDPIPSGLLERWRDLPAQAVRKGSK